MGIGSIAAKFLLKSAGKPLATGAEKVLSKCTKGISNFFKTKTSDSTSLFKDAGFRYAGPSKRPYVSKHPRDGGGALTTERLEHIAICRKEDLIVTKPWSQMTFDEKLQEIKMAAKANKSKSSGDVFQDCINNLDQYVDDEALVITRHLSKSK